MPLDFSPWKELGFQTLITARGHAPSLLLCSFLYMRPFLPVTKIFPLEAVKRLALELLSEDRDMQKGLGRYITAFGKLPSS